jgi:glycosyltransferase involved in cell wall biosynthesis
MRLLFTVEFYEPHKGGAEEVVKQLAERLVGFGHEVCVATTKIRERENKVINGVRVEEFAISGKAVRGISGQPLEKQRYQQFVCRDWDVVLNYAAEQWSTDLCFDILDKIKAKKVLIPCGYSLKKPAYYFYYQKLPEYLKKYDALVYMSRDYQDKKFGDEHGVGDKAVIISNGASSFDFPAQDDFDFNKRHGIKTKYLALTVANHYRAKGHDFVINAFKKMNRHDVTLLIVGNIPSLGLRRFGHMILGCYPFCLLSDMFNKNIKLLKGDDRNLVISAYKTADLFLFGSSFEYAPLVMYESFAAKTLFITRDVGNVRDHENLLKIVKTPEDMSKTANFYLDHRNERGKIIDAAFSEWQAKYNWEIIARQYEKLFGDLVNGKK